MYERIVAMMCDQFGLEPDEITEDTRFIDDLDIDSLDLVELVVEVENIFGMDQIPEEDLKKIKSVGDLVDYVSAHSDN
jgi:acyl carrier protein